MGHSSCRDFRFGRHGRMVVLYQRYNEIYSRTCGKRSRSDRRGGLRVSPQRCSRCLSSAHRAHPSSSYGAFRSSFESRNSQKLVWWVIAALAACVLANILIMIIKEPVGRMRFRAINSEVGQRLINAGLVKGYTPWYISNGQPDEGIINSFIDAYPGASDAFKSFPSGHTCAAGMSYALIMLPDVVDFKHKKRAKSHAGLRLLQLRCSLQSAV